MADTYTITNELESVFVVMDSEANTGMWDSNNIEQLSPELLKLYKLLEF